MLSFRTYHLILYNILQYTIPHTMENVNFEFEQIKVTKMTQVFSYITGFVKKLQTIQ